MAKDHHSEKSKELPYKLLKKYFEDTVSIPEKQEVEYWLNTPEKNLRYERYLRFLWDEMNGESEDPVVGINQEATLHKIHYKINHLNKKKKGRSSVKRTRKTIPIGTVLKYTARIAAVMLLPLLAYLGWEVYNQKLWVKNQTEIVYNEIVCPMGARSQFELPDGTTGSLNNGSRLKYPVKFTGNSREVELTGEAYFDVSHHRNRPFIISTDGLDVRVLGTRINIYSYPEECYQEFTLESGSAELFTTENDRKITVAKLKPGQHVLYRPKNKNNGTQPGKESLSVRKINRQEELDRFMAKMKSGQEALYQFEGGDMAVGLAKTETYTSWKDGKLVLRRDPMPMLLTRIERWYNVKFNVLDERINDYTYWVTFEEESLDRVLKLLALTGPIRFEKRPRVQAADGSYQIQEIDILLD
ncbi:MAG: FecR domain-containing protein [Bacteroidota bacterium]